MTLIESLSFFILVALSAFLSASEVALFSLSRFQLRSLKEGFRKTHHQAKQLLSDPSGLLITVLVINEVTNIAITATLTEALSTLPKLEIQSGIQRFFPVSAFGVDLLLGTLMITPFLLIVCEVTPKFIAARANRLIATSTVGPLFFIYQLFKPVRLLLQLLLKALENLAHPIVSLMLKFSFHRPGKPRDKKQTDPFGNESVDPAQTRSNGETSDSSSNDESRILRESDFMNMLEEGRKEGSIQHDEFELIKNVFEMDDTSVEEILTPLNEVLTLTQSTPLKTAYQKMRSQEHLRIPVLSDASIKEVVGILYSKDLLHARTDGTDLNLPISTLMRRPLLIHAQSRLNTVFRKFKQQRTHIGVVLDAQGLPLGIVSMKDLLATLFEDLLPEIPPKEGERK